MPRKQSPTLTEAELRLMEILWDRGEATVGDVVGALAALEPLAYSSVLTTMRILERKGYTRHRKEGRAFVYIPVVDRDAARSRAVRFIMDRFFDRSAESMMLNILKSVELDGDELERLKKMIEESDSE
jgi:predicted transcriptional regulator